MFVHGCPQAVDKPVDVLWTAVEKHLCLQFRGVDKYHGRALVSSGCRRRGGRWSRALRSRAWEWRGPHVEVRSGLRTSPEVPVRSDAARWTARVRGCGKPSGRCGEPLVTEPLPRPFLQAQAGSCPAVGVVGFGVLPAQRLSDRARCPVGTRHAGCPQPSVQPVDNLAFSVENP